MAKSKQLFVNLIASVVVFIIQFAISFFLSPYVVAKLGEEAYGFITLANNFTQYAMLIAVSINSMSSRFISLEYNRGNKERANQYYASVFWMNVFLSALVFIVSAILIFRIEHIINVSPELVTDVKLVFAFSFLGLIISFLTTCFNSSTFVTNRMDLHAYTQIATNVAKVLVILSTFILLAPKIYFVALATVICNLVAFIIYLFLKEKLLPDLSIARKHFSFTRIGELVKSGVWLLISDISSMFLNGMDLLLANLFISEQAMGRLSISKIIPTAVGSLLGFLSNIFAATFTRVLATGDKQRLVNEAKFTFKILGVFLAVPFAGIIVFGPEFFTLWLPGNVYDAAAIMQVYVLMLLTLINVIINAFMYSIHALLIALDKVKFYSIMVFGCSILSIISTISLVAFTDLGVYAVAGTSTAILGIINLFVIPLYVEKQLDIKPFTFLGTIFKSHGALILTCLLFFVIKLILPVNSWIVFFCVCALCAVIGYLADFLLLLNRDEKRIVLQKITARFKRAA
jgi:O-antigen/teichoic acid export membrane protein